MIKAVSQVLLVTACFAAEAAVSFDRVTVVYDGGTLAVSADGAGNVPVSGLPPAP